MTDEEKQAIEYIDKIVSDCENRWKQLGYTCNLYDGDEPIPVDVYKTVLNLIEKQQTEIKNLKQEKATAWEEWNIINEYCEQEEQKYKYLYQKALDCTIKSDRENLEKDKIIDEMAGYMATHKCWIYDFEQAFSKDIREHFERKVEENKC